MIEFFDEQASASFENVEVGDEFEIILYIQYGQFPCGVFHLKVVRVGKRDVFAKSPSGKEYKFFRKGENYNCYAVGAEKVEAARKTIRFVNRKNKCIRILEQNNNRMDTELMEAIEAFVLRIESDQK